MNQVTYIIYDYLYSLGTATGVSTGIVALAVGGILLFFGYKMKRIGLVLVGVIGGAALGAYLAEQYFAYGSGLYVAAPIVLAAILGIASFALYYLAVYILGLAAGGAVGIFIAYNYIDMMIWGLIIAVVLALIIGSITLATEKPIIILATSFIGYVAFRVGLYLVLPPQDTIVVEVICAVLLIAGIIFQFLTNKGKRSRIKREVRYIDTRKKERIR